MNVCQSRRFPSVSRRAEAVAAALVAFIQLKEKKNESESNKQTWGVLTKGRACFLAAGVVNYMRGLPALLFPLLGWTLAKTSVSSVTMISLGQAQRNLFSGVRSAEHIV